MLCKCQVSLKGKYKQTGKCSYCTEKEKSETNEKPKCKKCKVTKLVGKYLKLALQQCATCTKKTNKTEKKKIPQSLRVKVWNYYIGEENSYFTCLSCSSEKVTNRNWHCSHVIAEINQGESTVDNLVPTCQSCNQELYTKSMDEDVFQRYKSYKSQKAKQIAEEAQSKVITNVTAQRIIKFQSKSIDFQCLMSQIVNNKELWKKWNQYYKTVEKDQTKIIMVRRCEDSTICFDVLRR